MNPYRNLTPILCSLVMLSVQACFSIACAPVERLETSELVGSWRVTHQTVPSQVARIEFLPDGTCAVEASAVKFLAGCNAKATDVVQVCRWAVERTTEMDEVQLVANSGTGFLALRSSGEKPLLLGALRLTGRCRDQSAYTLTR